MASAKLRAMIAPRPPAPAGDEGPRHPSIEAATAAIDLLPIPAVLLHRQHGKFAFDAINKPVRVAGLGGSPEQSPLIADLGERSAAFIESESLREELPWQGGDTVDRRHYRVSLARVVKNREGRCFITLVDETGARRTERNLRREKMTDSLTGLPNRAGFSDRHEALLDDASERAEYAVLVRDLDRFSRVNACLGSMAGDELLITVARRIKGALRAGDVLARTGGDEFGILVRLEDGPADAEHVARRIQGALAAPFRLSDFEIRASRSIGIAYGSAQGEDAEELIRHAQFAVKRSKTSGRAEAYQPQAFALAREHVAGAQRALDAPRAGDQQ